MTVAEIFYAVSGNLRTSHLFLDATAGQDDDWDTAQTLMTPSLGNKLAITKIVLMPAGAGANYGISIGAFDIGSSEVSPDLLLFGDVTQATDFGPFEMNFENAPIVLAKDQFLKPKMSATGAYQASVALEAIEVPG